MNPLWKTYPCPSCDASRGMPCTRPEYGSFGLIRVTCNPHKARRQLTVESNDSAVGTVERAMKRRTELEIAWQQVVQPEVAA